MDLYYFDFRRKLMVKKEIIQMPDPKLLINTYIANSLSWDLSSTYHEHEEIEIIYIINGEMSFSISGDEEWISQGKILLINSMAVHSSKMPKDKYTNMYLLQFKPDVIYDTTQFSNFKYLSPFLQSNGHNYHVIDSDMGEDYIKLISLFNEIVEEFEQKRIAYEISIKSLLYRILTILYRNNVLIFSTMDSLYQQNEELNRLGKVIEYIELHYNEDINVEMACGLLNLNYFYFCRMFKKVIGRTFVQYLNYVRVSAAEKLLLTTNMPITDIIMETGFSSLSYFNRIFKSHKGCSPSTFRKSKTG